MTEGVRRSLAPPARSAGSDDDGSSSALERPRGLGRFARDNGLTLALVALFLASLVGHLLTGWHAHAEYEQSHGARAAATLLEYATSGDFVESLFENWESEFLQMAAYVALTAVLYQRGSAESREPSDEDSEEDEDPRLHRDDPLAPWPVRRGGALLWLYERSLTLALAALFLASFALHAWGGLARVNDQRALHGEPPETLWGYVGGAEFWFESFQNWQSEFLSVAVLVVLSVYLRQRGSPESKPVHYAHSRAGG